MEDIKKKVELYIKKAEDDLKNSRDINGFSLYVLKKNNYIVINKDDFNNLVMEIKSKS